MKHQAGNWWRSTLVTLDRPSVIFHPPLSLTECRSERQRDITAMCIAFYTTDPNSVPITSSGPGISSGPLLIIEPGIVTEHFWVLSYPLSHSISKGERILFGDYMKNLTAFLKILTSIYELWLKRT